METEDSSSEERFIAALYGDPIRPETARSERQLVIVSVACIAVVVLHGEFVPVSFFPVQFQNENALKPIHLPEGLLIGENERRRKRH